MWITKLVLLFYHGHLVKRPVFGSWHCPFLSTTTCVLVPPDVVVVDRLPGSGAINWGKITCWFCWMVGRSGFLLYPGLL